MRFRRLGGRIGPVRALSVFVTTSLVLLVPVSRGGEIHRAITAADLATVERLLATDPALASQPCEDDPFRSLPLHFAAMHGQVELARLLLDAGADIDAGDVDGSTALDVAALRRHPEVVELLLERGADVNRRDRNGACALSFAASAGDSAIVERLLQAGADLHFRSRDGLELVHYAALRGLDRLLDRLAETGHDMDAATAGGQTPLHYAAMGGQVGAAKRLLDAGADVSAPDSAGETALCAAAWRGRTEIGELLLSRGTSPDATGEESIAPLRAAVVRGHVDFVRLLLERGAEANFRDRWTEPILMSAVASGSAETVGLLLRAGSASNATEPDGCTALHLAALRGYGDVVATLLDGGADPHATDAAGREPLELAARYGHRGVTDQLAAHVGGTAPPLAPSPDAVARKGMARVRWMGHSGWAVETKDHLLVFDYGDAPRPPDEPALCNGHVDPAQLGGKPIVAFVSHAHGDHYRPEIFGWRERNPKITYVLGFVPAEEPAGEYERIGPRESRRIAGVDVTTLESNDSGVGFVVVADGVTVFHAGDHANRNRDLSGPYPAEIEWLVARGIRPDVALLPVSGCGFGDQEAVRIGAYWTLRTLKPKVFCPMHSGEDGSRLVEFVRNARDELPDVPMFGAERRGDTFEVRDGKMIGGAARL